MIAWLDTALPPLDRTVGFWLLVAVAIECLVVWLYRRGCERADNAPALDRYADAHGDVTRRPDA